LLDWLIVSECWTMRMTETMERRCWIVCHIIVHFFLLLLPMYLSTLPPPNGIGLGADVFAFGIEDCDDDVIVAVSD